MLRLLQRACHTCINIRCPYCHEQLLHTVRRHTVQMRQMQLEVHFVAEDVLAEGTADDRLHRVLWQDMHLYTTLVPTVVVTIRTLKELENMEETWPPLVDVLGWPQSVRSNTKSSLYCRSQSLHILRQHEIVWGSVTIRSNNNSSNNNDNNNNKQVYTAKGRNIFTCSWQNLLSSVGFDLFVATSSSLASRSCWVPPPTLTFSSFSGVIIPDSQKRIENLNFKRLTTSNSEKLHVFQTALALNPLNP